MFFFLYIILVSSKVFYLSDIKYPIPKCEIDVYQNNSIIHYSLNNIMGSIDIRNDPFVNNLIVKIYLSRYFNKDMIEESNDKLSSCGLCHLNSSFCKKPNLIFSQDVLVNFRISGKREAYGSFQSDIDNLKTKYRLTSNIGKFQDLTFASLNIPMDELLLFNNDTIDELSCEDNLEIIFQLIVSTKNISILRDFVLVPVDLIQERVNSFNILCIPGEEYLSNYDCSQSNVYRVIKYKIENCLIPKKRTIQIESNELDIYLNNSLGYFNDSENCSINDHIYYNNLYMNNNSLLLQFKWCNETLDSIFKQSIYDDFSLNNCHNLLNDCGEYYKKSSTPALILLKPYYRLYKETIIALLNYLNCLSKNNTRILEIDKMIYHSIGILKNSCYFKNTFELDLDEYSTIYNYLVNFNQNGKDHCIKCSNTSFLNEIKCREHLFYCRFVIENFQNYTETDLIKWVKNEINHLKMNDTNESNYQFGQIFSEFLDPGQYGTEATILFLFLLIIFIITLIFISTLIIQFIMLKIIANKFK